MALYKGFSTKNYAEQGGAFSLYDVALIEEDLLNEIFTLRGERVNEPTFGTRIPLMPFEPNDLNSSSVIQEDLERVIEGDPRVKLLNIDLITDPDTNNIVAVCKVEYIRFNIVRDLRITVNSR